MGPDFSDDVTRSVPPTSSDPLEIARKHRDDPPDHPEELPDKIGPYKILAYLGGGGMGLVYLAEQGIPSRRVAIKIIPPRRRTKEILARFDIEREALALMDHPNIAKVFDAGESDDGRPYFVMEYVHGISITEYCDKSKLTTNERLALFVEVCHAVHHAHQKGIIHRDIKPGNVLVAIQEDRPFPKVIDFGVAKAVGHQLTQRTIFTERGQLIGTPGYMSPEQAEMSALDIDTRTDIYSLGVLLYELLVGSQPFDTHKLLEAGFGEIQRVIREVDPPKPSTRFSSLGDDSTVVASNRKTVVRSLSRELRGDLDWITMKCLEKDRTHRYDSATALADDIQRHLRAEPVLAGPPSVIYKLRKFTRRHRFGVVAGSAIAAALIAGFVGTTVQYIRADREWKRAEEKAATATEVTDFMIDLFKVNDPSESLGNKILARDILDKGADRIRKQLSNRPLIQAAMMDAIGNVYSNLGLYKAAEELLRKAVEIRKSELPDPHDDSASALHHLGVVLDRWGKHADAESYHKEGLAIRERLYGREHVATSESRFDLATAIFNLQRWGEAERLYEEVLAIRLKLLPPDDPRVAEAMVEVGRVAHYLGKWANAKTKYESAAVVYSRQYGKLHPQTLECKFLLADVALAQRHVEESYRLHEEVLRDFTKLYGADDIHVAACKNNFSRVLMDTGNLDEAESMVRDALRINEGRLEPNHGQIASDYNTLGTILRMKGNSEEAEPLHRKSLEMRLLLEGPDGKMVGMSRLCLGISLGKTNRFDEGEKELLEAVRVFLLVKAEPERLDSAHRSIVDLYDRWGQPEKAAKFREIRQQNGFAPLKSP